MIKGSHFTMKACKEEEKVEVFLNLPYWMRTIQSLLGHQSGERKVPKK